VAIPIPEIKTFKPIQFPDFSEVKLDNGIPVYQLASPEHEVMKLEINFRAGRFFETQKGVSRACANQLREGTKKHNSEFIADIFDYHGATLQSHGGMDFSRVELYSINRFFDVLLPYVKDILDEPDFSEKELNNYRQRNKQRLAIDLAKNDVLAYRTLTESLFGLDHPYGYNSVKSTYDQLSRSALVHHFERCYEAAIPGIILAGGIDDSILEKLNHSFGQRKINFPPKPNIEVAVLPKKEMIALKGEQKFQSTIRMGRRLFSRSNKDYPGIYVLNAILGGFFGSRLMQNIREDKGLTYDIFSMLDMYWTDGYIMIGAEVANENVDLVLSELQEEFRKLREESITSEELTLVKNYLNGNLLNLLNGPFNSIELLRLITILGYDLSFFNHFMHTIHQMDAEYLRDLARTYLNPDDFTTVIVGN
jgi:zinc protease